MQPGTQFRVDVTDPSGAGEARRAIVRCAEDLHMSEAECGAVAIAVTEMATNVVKHAKHGSIICQPVSQNGSSGLRVLALDAGPGIRDISAALHDGYSTTGTSGSGLGAVKRLATRFEIYTIPEQGTCVLAEFWPQRSGPGASLQVGVVSVPIRGESVCGDGWHCKSIAEWTCMMVVDGLGHGEYAAEAAREAECVFAESESNSPARTLRDCHDALKKTRGAAAAVAAINRSKGTLVYAGVGNVSGSLLSPGGSRGLASHNGTVGHQFPRAQEFTTPWNPDSILIMHTDGLGSRWDLDHYPGLCSKPPCVMAGVLYRDFARLRDDVTVLVAKNS